MAGKKHCVSMEKGMQNNGLYYMIETISFYWVSMFCQWLWQTDSTWTFVIMFEICGPISKTISIHTTLVVATQQFKTTKRKLHELLN